MMGNYSLLDAINPVEITPLGQDILRDPRAADRMATDLSGMSAYQNQAPGVLLAAEEPGGIATAKPGSTFLSATPEDDSNIVMKTIGTVLGAPFNLLRGAKEGLEEAIGHPYAMQREAQDEQYAMLASVLSDSDKAAMGMPVDRTGVNARQTNTSTVATGNNYGVSPTLTPRKTGIVELLTGESRKQRALQMAQLQAALKAQGINLNIESLKTGIYKDKMTGWNQEMQGFRNQSEAYEVPADHAAQRATEKARQAELYAGATENYAQAGEANAGAFYKTSQGNRVNALLPFEQDRMTAQTRGYNERANTEVERRPSLLAYDAARTERERSSAVRNYGSTAATLGKMQNGGDVATGVKREIEFDKQTGALKKQASNLLSGNISGGKAQSLGDVSNMLGVPLKTVDDGWLWDTQALDWDKYAADNKPATTGVVKGAQEKSVWEALADLRKMVDEATNKATTGGQTTPTVATKEQPPMPDATINPVTIDDYDKVVPTNVSKTSEVRDLLMEKYGLGETQAREVARALYYRRGGR